MTDSRGSPHYVLGTFSIAGAPPFPGLLIAERVVALHALVPVCRRLGCELRNTGSLLTTLDDWPSNERALRQAAVHLTDHSEELARLSAPLGVLKVHAP